MGSLNVDSSVSTVHLISLGGDHPAEDINSGQEHDGSRSTSVCEDGSSTSSSAELVPSIVRGLLVPSIPLSTAAAQKLQQQTGSNNYNGHCSHNNETPLAHNAAATSAGKSVQTTQPRLLRWLPTELLYDDAGLQLFDQITYLPEYYLTSAEADILARCGPEIVRQCVADDTSLIELGAGSMRKTKLLLDAVVLAGLKGVSFFALDLCEQSLKDALGQLQDHFEGRIQLAGLVGTYQQGLSYIQQQLLSSNSTFAASGVPNTSSNIAAMTATANKGHSNTAVGVDIAAAKHESSKQLAPAGPDDHPRWLTADSSAETASEGNSTASSETRVVAAVDDNISSKSRGTSMPMNGSTEHRNSHGLGHNTYSSSSRSCGRSGPGKLIMWLGSSIGNYSREEAADFLAQLRDLAMQPGDLLLVGIDRRNNPQKVAKAYNDATGVTAAFIMNGMRHCRTLLNQELQAIGQNVSLAADGPLAASEVCSEVQSQTSLDLEGFEYFCLYNDELGRHEAYYLATRDTKITLPATLPQGVLDTPLAPGVCDVSFAAGELIHIEYSYKYSQQEVHQLAAAAGLKWMKAWTDSKLQYDLHLFSREG